jgi:hypothetical protein
LLQPPGACKLGKRPRLERIEARSSESNFLQCLLAGTDPTDASGEIGVNGGLHGDVLPLPAASTRGAENFTATSRFPKARQSRPGQFTHAAG